MKKNEIVKINQRSLPSKGPNALEKFGKLQGKLAALKSSLNKNEVIPRIYNQLVLFVLDGSRSMEGLSLNKISKAQDIHENVQKVLDRLRNSKNKTSFDICFVAFSDEFKNVFGIKELKEVSEQQSFNSLKLLDKTGGTQLLPALCEVEKMVDEYMDMKDNLLPRNTLILLMTDGMMDDYKDSLMKIEELKLNENLSISVMYLDQLIEEGSKWYSWDEEKDELDYSKETPVEEVREKRKKRAEKLKHFASSDDLFMSAVDPEAIRNHMINSITATSQLI
ncbi:vWA domain-containing protein [Algoriphagus antarcticus]|uniref:von Willebrand factor type A domain-containing protein n=1 Tax=Algoriphagus antarcticus TaxID=238540 RepID=A0A3E0DQB4_9BACT|nr:vWA domain-containing protein [Algoriphagus antarcticus]REG85315.1 von Willebrand factor type A domain-containing protein [Algoriphagus antarcticus]